MQTIVTKPKPIDVLCGRGKTCFEHEGNNAFRKIVAQHIDAYSCALTKKAKMQVVVRVVDIVLSQGGRFLVRNRGSPHYWVDGGSKQGKKKAGHALRDALRGRVKCVEKLRMESNMSKSMIPIPTLTYSSSEEFASDSSLDSHNETDAFFNECLDSLNSDDFRLNCDDLSNMKFHDDELMTLEPEKEWKQSKLQSEMAHDLLDFFNGDHTNHMVPVY
mmetsp:Transcript_26859/g.40652  ORF Transcript_26859/g.40652 Transcript_26859/m.40652 type:complete len:217 (+) Transcript_26859:264-914(+)|eukprot:CAMPEP_0178914026 /NCGR_PEP_ID=MMETSP0786-20121207/11179_1 /TAXON_ID=186022 /ORGANISM="Thalassionema frauenfeldii, Strain CCMP 1798" /LENGTH=216 /DNA_ID=CAMNT_0020586853 /DNA_START=259 /DNA_END=909 /DNA_ORIENTATION=-